MDPLDRAATAPRALLAEKWMGGPADQVPVATVQALWRKADPADVTLRHALQLALRHALDRVRRLCRDLPAEGPESREIAALARTIPTPEAAVWLLNHLRNTDGGGADLVKIADQPGANLARGRRAAARGAGQRPVCRR